MPPRAALSQSLEELQAELDFGGVRAMAVRCMVNYNPQWELEIVNAKILQRKLLHGSGCLSLPR